MSDVGGPLPEDLPSLPPELHDELLAILFGDPQRRDAELARLRAGAGVHLGNLEIHLRHHQRLAKQLGPSPGIEIPGYRILQTLGEGGMGVVYLAEQVVPLRRKVALKVVKLGMDSREILARFERERQALAVMDHGAIAKIYDCGTTSRGQPFFAMEFVPGQPIDVFCDQRRLSMRERIELFQQVCRGVQHAHQKGVIHRDIKPGNVLAAEQDGQRSVKVIDFGIARATVQTNDAQQRTEIGQLVGTPEYMSPEQAAGDAAHVDTRTDVYSLGAILYELVSGTLPFTTPELRAMTFGELSRRLRDEDVPRPSTRLHALGALATATAARRRSTLSSLQRQLRGDLDWIVLRAMAREPDRRYASAAALTDDLQRFLDGQPVLAGPPSRWYHLRKYARRYRVALTTASLVAASLVLGLVGTRIALGQAQRSRQRFDLLSHVVQLQEGRASAAALPRPNSTRTAEFERWLHQHADPLDAAMRQVESALRDLAAGDTDADLSLETRRFLREKLQGYVDDAATFRAGAVADVQRRLQWSSRIRELTLHHPRARVGWEQARAAIRAAVVGGQDPRDSGGLSGGDDPPLRIDRHRRSRRLESEVA